MPKKTQIGALTLCFILIIRMMAMPLLYLDYNLRKDFIKKNLCENRFRPALHCNGQCYLAKRIAATEQKETTEKGADLAKILFEIPCTPLASTAITFPLYFRLYRICYPSYCNLYNVQFFAVAFKPPIQHLLFS